MKKEENNSIEETKVEENQTENIEVKEPENIEVKESENIETKEPTAKRSFLDFNFSWIMLLIDLAIIFGFGTLNLQVAQDNGLGLNPTLYICLIVLISLLSHFIIYTVGKFVGGLLGGYRLTKVMMFGFTIIFTEKDKENITSFKLGNIMDFHMVMTPKKEKTNHFWYMLGGMGAYLILTLIVLVLTFFIFTKERDPLLYYSLIFSMTYGFIVILYQLFPCRLDYVNDCFILIKTRKKEDLDAYNNELKNIRHGLLGEDYEIQEFDNYDSFYKSHTLYYQYIDALLKDDIDKAIALLEETKKYNVWFTDDIKTKIIAERLFVLLSAEGYDDAEKLYANQKRDLQNNIINSADLSSFRTVLLIEGIINNMKDDADKVIESYRHYCEIHKEVDSLRIKKEKEFFKRSLDLVNKARPGWELKLPESI